MPAIKLTEDQLAILGETDGNVILTDEYGNHVGYDSPPLTQAEIEELHRRADSDGPWYTTAEVLEHLKSLDK